MRRLTNGSLQSAPGEQEIAKPAGEFIATISRVVKDTGSGSDETREGHGSKAMSCMW